MQNYAIQAVSLHSGWKSMMRVGAIDCAQDENVPVIQHNTHNTMAHHFY